MMPAAIENRNDVFMTDHGSSRDSRSRALRVRRATPALGFALSAALGGAGVTGTTGSTAVLGPAMSSALAAAAAASCGEASGTAGWGKRDCGEPALVVVS